MIIDKKELIDYTNNYARVGKTKKIALIKYITTLFELNPEAIITINMLVSLSYMTTKYLKQRTKALMDISTQ